jgi:integrase
MFDPAEIRLALEGRLSADSRGRRHHIKPSPALKAMILLGINCGFGNNDCGSLPLDAVDLDAGWINFARPKTGIDRRCPLWPETVAALRDWLTVRPEPQENADAGLVFLTTGGTRYAKDESTDNPVSKETRKLFNRLGIDKRRSFYGLRHCFETIGGASRDQVAVDCLMGHADNSMAATYRDHVGDDRLLAVVAHVHAWLFNSTPSPPTAVASVAVAPATA